MKKLIIIAIALISAVLLNSFDVRYFSHISTLYLEDAEMLEIGDDRLIVKSNDELYHYDTFSPVFPYLKEVFTITGSIDDFTIVDNKVLYASEDLKTEITKKDTISTTMTKLSFKEYFGSSIEQEGANVFIGHSDTGLIIEDIQRGLISQYHDTHGIISLAVNWPSVFAINSIGLEVVNVEDIYNPEDLGRNSAIFHPEVVAVSGNKCIVGTKNQILFVDVKDPGEPTIVKTIRTAHRVEDIEIKDDDAYIALGKGGLYVYNISNIKKPKMLDDYNTRGYCKDIEISADYIYVADGNAGVIILKFD